MQPSDLIREYEKVAEDYRELRELATDEDTRILCDVLAAEALDSAAALSGKH